MDRHPITPLDSSLSTSPPRTTSSSVRRRPRAFGMVGKALSYSSDGEFLVPSTKPGSDLLAAWDNARQHEPIIKAGIAAIALSVASRLGPYVHPDPSIQAFVQDDIKLNVYRWIQDLTTATLWSGSGTAENIFQPRMGPNGPQVRLQDLVCYHPLDVDIVTDNHGRLVHGVKLNNSKRETGIWVPKPEGSTTASGYGNKIRLQKGKVVHTSYGGESNNPYGASFLTAVLDFHLFKKVIIDLMMVALDRYGTPLTYLVVPAVSTDEVDPDNPDRRLTLQEVSQKALENLRTDSVLIFSQPQGGDPNAKIEMKTLTTSNNFADSFTSASELMDQNMMTGMLIPNLIFRDNNNGLGTGGASEKQMELFSNFISSIYTRVVNDFLSQSILQLIQYNFDPREHPLAYQAGEIKPLPMRSTDVKVLSDVIKMMTEAGYIDPTDENDRNHVRQLFSFPASPRKDPPSLSPSISTASLNRMSVPRRGRNSIRVPLRSTLPSTTSTPLPIKSYA